MSGLKEKKELTLETLSELLDEKGLITKKQYQDIRVRGEIHRARLYKESEPFHLGSRLHTHQEVISPAEIIASFNFVVPGKKGKVLTEDMVTELIAGEVGIPYIKIDPLKLSLDVVTANVARPFAQRHLLLPFEEKDGVVTVAVADPFNLEAVESLKKTMKLKVKLALASKSDIMKIVREFFGFRASVIAAQKEMGGTMDLGNLEQYVRLKGTKEIEANDKHVVSAVEYLLHYAFDQRASDIHIEPKRDNSLVRLRIDGMLHYIHSMPKAVHPSIISRVKMLSRMDISEKRRPQDGRIKTEFKGREIELRISTMPTAFGEKLVIRIFDPEMLFQEFRDLGFYKSEYQRFTSYLSKRNGMILVTGPTGSGKTTTLYSALKKLSSPEVNIITIEDPIEMIMEEFNQIGVQPQIGVDFASTLRTILRQDPDIIMVGEIRDAETANNAVQAALTGHLVLSTLHTNDAPSSVARLLDLGVPQFLISSTVLGIVAQRLVRKICSECKVQRSLRAEEIAYLKLKKKEYRVCYGEGCIECRGTGYKGRTGIFEIMDFSAGMKGLFLDRIDHDALFKKARAEGMTVLREGAIKKMIEGVTTYEEVVTVTG